MISESAGDTFKLWGDSAGCTRRVSGRAGAALAPSGFRAGGMLVRAADVDAGASAFALFSLSAPHNTKLSMAVPSAHTHNVWLFIKLPAK